MANKKITCARYGKQKTARADNHRHPPDFVIAYPKKYKSYNFSRQECKKQGFSRIGGRACYFTRLFARLPKQQKQPLIINHLQTYFEKVTKSGKKHKCTIWKTKNRKGRQPSSSSPLRTFSLLLINPF